MVQRVTITFCFAGAGKRESLWQNTAFRVKSYVCH